MKGFTLLIAALPLLASASPLEKRGEWDECPPTMIFNYGSGKCFQPRDHPSPYNCQYIHQCYNPHTVKCYPCRDPGQLPTCPHDQYWRPNLNRCDYKQRKCSKDETYDPTTRECKRHCPHPYEWDGHRCVRPRPVCRHDQRFDEREWKCVCKEPGYVEQGGRCVRPQPQCRHDQRFDEREWKCVCKEPGYVEQGGRCVRPQPQCRHDQRFDEREWKCVCKEPGYVEQGGRCVRPQPQCRHDQRFDERAWKCVCRERGAVENSGRCEVPRRAQPVSGESED